MRFCFLLSPFDKNLHSVRVLPSKIHPNLGEFFLPSFRYRWEPIRPPQKALRNNHVHKEIWILLSLDRASSFAVVVLFLGVQGMNPNLPLALLLAKVYKSCMPFLIQNHSAYGAYNELLFHSRSYGYFNTIIIRFYFLTPIYCSLSRSCGLLLLIYIGKGNSRSR